LGTATIEDDPKALAAFKAAHPGSDTQILDIDRDDMDDVQACAQYIREIYEYLLKAEVTYAVPPDFLSRQTDFGPDDRTLLLDWISKIHMRFNLANESWFHCCAVLDRYLCIQQVPRLQSRLLGITILLISAKFEQSYIPSLRHFVEALNSCEEEYVPRCHCQLHCRGPCDHCSKEAIIDMEEYVLQAVDYRLAMPTPLTFLRRYCKIAEMNHRNRYISFYICELCCLNYPMCRFKPSEIAAGCVAMTRRLTRSPAWSETLQEYSGYTEADVRPAMAEVSTTLKLFATNPKAKYVHKKYSLEDRFYSVSLLIENVVLQALSSKK